MKRNDIISVVSEKTGVSKKEVKSVIESLEETVVAELSNGGEVDLYGFMNFKRGVQKGRTGKVPGTEKTYTTEDKFVVKTKAGKAFRDAVEASK